MDLTKYLRSQGQYSVRDFADKAQLGSTNYMKMVMDGRRNLGSKTSTRVAKALGLNKSESDFFFQLIEFNQAKNDEKKNRVYQELIRFRRFQKARAAAIKEYEVFSHWYHLAILEAMGTTWALKPDSEKCESLGITKEEYRSSIKLLKEIGLLEEKGGKLIRKDANLETPSQLRSLSLRQYYKEMMKKSLGQLNKLGFDELGLASVTIALSDENFRKMKSHMIDMMRKANMEFAEDMQPDAVYQVTMSMVPLLNVSGQIESKEK